MSCSTIDSHRVSHIANSMISHERGKGNGLQLRQTERPVDIASVTRIRGGKYFYFTTIATSSVTSMLAAAHLIGK